jgi:hypothetical protein
MRQEIAVFHYPIDIRRISASALKLRENLFQAARDA